MVGYIDKCSYKEYNVFKRGPVKGLAVIYRGKEKRR